MALITLTSDIGGQDYLVGAVKGQLMQMNPDFRLVDISHQLPPFNYPQAAYVCRNAIRHFPSQSYHIILVNLFDRKPDHMLLAYHNDQYFLCADNGLLTMILEERPEMVIGLPLPKSLNRNTIECVKTFGQAINDILEGKRLTDIGIPDIPIIEKKPLKPWLSDEWMEGHIIFIDNFENVVVNITREQFEEQRRGRKFSIVFKRNEVIDRISESYADAPEGEKLAIFNAAGYLEISINKGNAAGLFGLQGYLEQAQNTYIQSKLYYQTVKIFFE
ncbi:SAM-dependent chlorinase/fluorinase [Flavihumibacter rivuli]|uniref:SAM hydrolase/SAM-dependent halogenase family protein n=1 Tax=Flavihumibacter rivuli TaxID=2838156 RepID=UPI001BDED92D|nr:SAM-dependent chlorinase/fluorinase [Flavihumibacter rivuli]ULQ57453.1 SAM-dependent chlorinase/fluorinase [Flavihumibacter rivuli]